MSRGFARGLVFGGVVAVLGLGVVSQVSTPPQRAANSTEPVLEPGLPETGVPAPTDAAPETPEASSEPLAPQAAEMPPAEPAPAEPTPVDTETVPQATEPATDDAGNEPAAMTLPPALAEAPVAPSGALAPPSGESALSPPPPEAAPSAPGVEMGPADAELPPPPPLTPEEEALLLPPETELPPAPAEIGPEAVDPAEIGLLPVEPPESGTTPADAAEPATPETPPQLPGDGPALAPEGGIRPDPMLPPASGRLPRIGDAPAPAAEPVPGVDLPTVPEDAPALIRYARAFDNPAGKPVFAILLIDTGGPTLDRERLAALDFPVTFVIDPQAPDATAAEAIYRAAGQEVVTLATGIPKGASASDLEQTFQANGVSLPQSVAVLDPGTEGFQDNRPLAGQVVPLIKAQGRGLVTWDRGLNAADQVARRDGVPAARIFRRLDGEGEATPVIRRYLDRAAFKAVQEGRVTVIGETRPETIAALLEWTVEGRAAQVALAPLTAVLAGE